MSKLKSRRTARAAAGNSLYTDRKALILTAAANVFLRKGFLATKLSDIAEEANMDRASLYYYFGSKQVLFEEIFTSSVYENVEGAKAVAKEKISSVDKLTKLIEMLLVSFEQKYPFFYIFVQEDLKKIEQLNDPKNDKWLVSSKKLSKEYFDIIKKIISQGIEKGEIKTSLPPNLIAHSLIGMMNSSSKWFVPNGPMSAKEIGAAMAKMVLYGLNCQIATIDPKTG
ncbi:MAG: TetR/AcrR family transcriptional regulator [Spongiibacteraceae bacterium]